MKDLTLCVPYFSQPAMLREQISHWNQYPPEIRIALVDDGSPIPAKPVVLECATIELLFRLDLYRVQVNLDWNRGGARNLASQEALTDWLCHVDIDHILKPECAVKLLAYEPDPKCFYRFERYRKGAADETRRKDPIPEFVTQGKVRPHIDSFVVTKAMYWSAGGYDESFTGCLGGGSPFLKHLESVAKPKLLPGDIHLHVYTRSVIKDSSVTTLSRDRDEYAARKRKMIGQKKAINPIRFPWLKEDLFSTQP